MTHLLKVGPSTSRPGEFFWRCIADTCVESGSFQPTIGAANNTARQHALTNCPTVDAATDRLLSEVLELPTYRPVLLSFPNGALMRGWFCHACQHLTADRDEHTAGHLDARDRERRGEGADHG